MAYGEYTEDWRFRDEHSSIFRKKPPQPTPLPPPPQKNKKNRGVHTHTPEFRLGGIPGISPTTKDQFPPLFSLHNPNKTESGCVDFSFRIDY